MRSSLAGLSIVFIAACGGGGNVTAPAPPYPDMAGEYQMTGCFDGIPSSAASLSGLLILTQASQNTAVIGGSIQLTGNFQGDLISLNDVLDQGEVTPAGKLTFAFSNPTVTWTFTGQHTGTSIQSGRYTATLSGQPVSGEWEAQRSSAATHQVAALLTCAAPPPTTGTLRITTATTGADQDPDGYVFAVDGGAGLTIGTNAFTILANLTAGVHSVQLSGVASNCTVQGANPASVTVPAGGTAGVAFAANCTPIATTIVAVSGDGQSAVFGSELSAPLVVQVLDARGNPVAGTPVTWVVGQGAGSVAPTTSLTDAQGRTSTRWTLGSSPGNNTVSAVVSGVGTASFTATGNKAETTTKITAEGADPSTVGQTVRIQFTVTSASGTPTGTVTVTVSGGPETCSGSVADGFCDLTFTVAGDHRVITATYSGDARFNPSFHTEPHRVI